MWMNVGNAGFSGGTAVYTSLAINPVNNEPYAAFDDELYSHKARLMKFDGNDWIDIGGTGFSKGIATWINLAFNSSGIPYVGYVDFGNNAKATVMKYDSVMVGLTEKTSQKIIIYPNPAKDLITIIMPEPLKSGYFTISNLKDQELIRQLVTEQKTHIQISTLSRGIYFAKFSNDRAVEVLKIIKE